MAIIRRIVSRAGKCYNGFGDELMKENNDIALARKIAGRVAQAGGRALFVGGVVRDALMDLDSKDIDIEIYGLKPENLKSLLAEMGTVVEKGANFGVYGLSHTHLDIALPRREHCVGGGHRDFEVDVDPYLPLQAASMRRDFTINAMMQDVLTGELIDQWGGREDLKAGIIRRVSDATFPEDALRVFRAAQFAARLNAQIEPKTMALCTRMNVSEITMERVFEEMSKALLKADSPSIFFRQLRAMNHLKEFFPELEACIGVRQNPQYHPEGDVFEHTMLVLDCAAALRDQAQWPLAFMIAALLHDLGKVNATQVQSDGKITSYGHEVMGLEMAETQMYRLTRHARLIEYVKNMMWLHMRPNAMAMNRSRKKKTRQLFDMSVCPEDLILLSRADASGKLDKPYNVSNEAFLRERLDDYRRVMARPMVTGQDLINAGLQPGPDFSRWLDRARQLHFSGLEHRRALAQVLAEARQTLKKESGKNLKMNNIIHK